MPLTARDLTVRSRLKGDCFKLKYLRNYDECSRPVAIVGFAAKGPRIRNSSVP